MSVTVSRFAISVLGALAMFAAAPAHALVEDPNPSSGLDAKLRPHFDYFLWKKQHRIVRPDPAHLSHMPLATSLSIDCAAGETINQALRHLADNGILYIRSSGACRDPVFIQYPVTIIGQPASPFDGATGHDAVIASPPGAPCIEIDRGVKHVEIRDLTVDGPRPAASPASWWAIGPSCSCRA